MHPGNRILSYILTALAIPGLSFFHTTLALSGAIALILWARRSPWRLAWRTRWLFIVLVLGYAYSLPGDALLPVLGEFAPTRQGLLHGLERGMHLWALLSWLDLLVLSLPPSRLVAALDGLMRPIATLGVDTGRVALRLALTLRAIESLERAPTPGMNRLHGLFAAAVPEHIPERVTLERMPFRLQDWLGLALLLLLFATWLVLGRSAHD